MSDMRTPDGRLLRSPSAEDSHHTESINRAFEIQAEIDAVTNDLAVALAEVRRLRAGIEHIACSGWPNSLQRYVDNLLAPVDLT